MIEEQFSTNRAGGYFTLGDLKETWVVDVGVSSADEAAEIIFSLGGTPHLFPLTDQNDFKDVHSGYGATLETIESVFKPEAITAGKVGFYKVQTYLCHVTVLKTNQLHRR